MRALMEAVSSLFEDDDLEDIDRDLYSAGYCHVLALALSRKTGHPMCALLAKEGRRWSIIHVMVEVNQGVYLDIEGERSLDDILFDADIDEDEVAIEVQEVDENTLRKWVRRGLVPITPELLARADAAADRLIAREGL